MNFAVVLAGGSGLRMGGNQPKQFISVMGKPIIIRSLEAFAAHDEIHGIVAVCKAECLSELKSLIQHFGVGKILAVVEGGNTRQASVYNGIRRLDSPDSIVLVHDGVRPLVSAKIITDNIAAAKSYGAVNTVVPAADTMLVSDDGKFINRVPDRQTLFHAQTPQSFKLELLMVAHQAALASPDSPAATDDCQLVLRGGLPVAMVQGSRRNIKVTTPEDLILLEALLKEMEGEPQ